MGNLMIEKFSELTS